jgi:hypothetical protein
MHPGAFSLAERGDFDASIHTLGAMASKLGVGPSGMLATRQAFLRQARIPSSVRDPGRGTERGDRPMDRDPFCEFGADKGWEWNYGKHRCDTATESRPLGVGIRVNVLSTQTSKRIRYCFIGLIL